MNYKKEECLYKWDYDGDIGVYDSNGSRDIYVLLIIS
jgi:hypothetical protein